MSKQRRTITVIIIITKQKLKREKEQSDWARGNLGFQELIDLPMENMRNDSK